MLHISVAGRDAWTCLASFEQPECVGLSKPIDLVVRPPQSHGARLSCAHPSSASDLGPRQAHQKTTIEWMHNAAVNRPKDRRAHKHALERLTFKRIASANIGQRNTQPCIRRQGYRCPLQYGTPTKPASTTRDKQSPLANAHVAATLVRYTHACRHHGDGCAVTSLQHPQSSLVPSLRPCNGIEAQL